MRAYIFKLRLKCARIKKPAIAGFFAWFAEREGFEPPDLLQTLVFKTSALNRSAISPVMRGKNKSIPYILPPNSKIL